MSGIVFINRNGLRWCGASKEFDPAKTLYNRWKRWGDMGVFARMMEGVSSEPAVSQTVMIPSRGLQANRCRAADATYLKAHPLTGSTCKACVRGVRRPALG